MGEPMPHAGLAAYWRATADPSGMGPTRTLTEEEFKAAEELGDWARRERAADEGRGRDEDDSGEDEGAEEGAEEPGSRPGLGRS